MAQIGLNVAGIVSIIVESILYGKIGNELKDNQHLIGDARRAYLAFIVSEAYFLDNNFNTFKNSVYGVETFVADAVLLYRCYIVWRDFKIITLPIILWMATIVTGIHTIWSVAQPVSIGEAIFLNETARWVTAFYSVALTANLSATMLLAYRIWRVNGAVHASSTSSSSGIGTFNNMNPRIGQIIPITFYVIIIRTSLHRLTDKQKLDLYNQYTSNYTLPSSRNIVIRVDEAALAMSDMDSASAAGTDRMPRKSNASLTWSVPGKSLQKTEY
ncbi:hypothetical protein Clacol_000233 [Clathrus columnatus]|uniref:Uncharacterized protein n=1 Tax=Clathrus columnatus TaxID=1419009 RepID=A0AAV4ZWT7_9AGAM|nr:hypothetical protein Clacol_000233 [Clathrus columnatus]